MEGKELEFHEKELRREGKDTLQVSPVSFPLLGTERCREQTTEIQHAVDRWRGSVTWQESSNELLLHAIINRQRNLCPAPEIGIAKAL